MAKVYTLDEISQHNTKDDCWVVIFGKVYDATRFLEEHPGGGEVIVKATGKDATQEFEDIGHSHDAWAILEKLYVGDVDNSTLKTEYAPVKLQLNPDRNKRSKTSSFIITLLQILLPLIILNVAISYYRK